MARQPVYVVRSTINPGVPYDATRAEYEHLVELGILSSLDEVLIPKDQIVIQTTPPVSPVIGDIWFNPALA